MPFVLTVSAANVYTDPSSIILSVGIIIIASHRDFRRHLVAPRASASSNAVATTATVAAVIKCLIRRANVSPRGFTGAFALCRLVVSYMSIVEHAAIIRHAINRSRFGKTRQLPLVVATAAAWQRRALTTTAAAAAVAKQSLQKLFHINDT